MKRINIPLFLTVLMSMVGNRTFAYDIAVKNTDGVTIYYNFINNGTELEVTYYELKSDGPYTSDTFVSNAYIDSVVIPESVDYNGKKYSFVA